MRKLLLPLVAGLMLTGIACTNNNDTADNPAHPGWTNTEYRVGRDAFFDGYGTPDAFGNCAFEWFVDHYLPSDVEDLAEDSYEAQQIISQAALACRDAL